MSADVRLRELLHEMAPPAGVPGAQEALARAALHAAYRDAAQARPSRPGRPSFAWVTAMVAAVVVAAALLLPGSNPPVDASLAQIARAARNLEVEQLPAGSFVYSHAETTVLGSSQIEGRGEQLFYLLPTMQHLWVQGATEQRTTTVGTPTFFDAADEAAYYAGGIDVQDGVGETRTDRLGDIQNVPDITRWSDDTAKLRDQIATELAKEPEPVLDDDIRLILLVEELMHPRLNAPPNLRAALIEIVGSMDVDTTELADGWVLVRLEYDDPALGAVAQELEFDGAGYLRARRSIALEPGSIWPIPPGTTIAQSTWSRPYVVDGAGIYPEGR